jgi:hypothetical protein
MIITHKIKGRCLGGSYPFCEISASDRNPTGWGDSWKTETNGGMETICLFYLFGDVRDLDWIFEMEMERVPQRTQA